VQLSVVLQALVVRIVALTGKDYIICLPFQKLLLFFIFRDVGSVNRFKRTNVSETCSRAASDLGLKIFALQTFSTDMITYIKQGIRFKSRKLLYTDYNML